MSRFSTAIIQPLQAVGWRWPTTSGLKGLGRGTRRDRRPRALHPPPLTFQQVQQRVERSDDESGGGAEKGAGEEDAWVRRVAVPAPL